MQKFLILLNVKIHNAKLIHFKEYFISIENETVTVTKYKM